MCTSSAYFWYRKRRIIGLSDGQKYFVYSLNVHPKLELGAISLVYRLSDIYRLSKYIYILVDLQNCCQSAQ